MSRAFWWATLERALKTLAQSFIAAVMATGAASAWTIPWLEVLGITVLATLLSVASSISSAEFGNHGPSLATEELKP